MNKKSLRLVCVTIGLFALSLLFLPKNMVSHFNWNGEVTDFSNKYSVFLLFCAIDILGSLIWNKTLGLSFIFKFLTNVKLREALKFYFSFLLFLLFLSLMVASFTAVNMNWVLGIGNCLYIVYLLIIGFKSYRIKFTN